MQPSQSVKILKDFDRAGKPMYNLSHSEGCEPIVPTTHLRRRRPYKGYTFGHGSYHSLIGILDNSEGIV